MGRFPTPAPERSQPAPAARCWQRSDPRARLLITIAVSGAVVAAGSWEALGLGLLAAAALHAASGTGWQAAIAALQPFRVLLLFTLLAQLAFTAGTPLLPGFLPALTREGCSAAGQALLRLSGVIAVSAHLVSTTSPLELARSFGWAIAPTARLGVPVREVTLVMALGFHFFPVLLDESRQIRAALESRGISLRHPRLRLRVRALLFWTVAVLFGMVDRSSRLAAALDARGFALPGIPRHRFPPWSRESTLLLAAGLGVAAGAILLALR